MNVIFFEVTNNGEKEPVLESSFDRVPDKGEKVFIDGHEWRVNNVATDIVTSPRWSVNYCVHIFRNDGI